jgi:HAE1 family hydrophobic/amphiphilic exporter-1
MSIPRTAIERPIMMAMISAIVILLGAISLTRLPVDLLPDIQQPTITVRINYPGVGPLEIEELLTRPLEQALSATAGLEQINSTSQEGNANLRLNFAWSTDLNEAMNDMRTRIDRVRARLPEDADPPTIFKFDSNSAPIMGLGVEGNYDRVTLRELAENVLSPRLERTPGVASVTVNGGLRRQIHVELSKEKIQALDLSVDRVVNILRTENQNIPLGEIYRGDMTYLVRSQGQFSDLDQIRDLVVLTRQGVPVYLRDLAEVKDSTEDIRSILRINGKAGVRMNVQKQSGTNTVQIAEQVRKEIERINREVPGVKLTGPRRQRQVHRALDQRRERARDDRVGARHHRHLPVPSELPIDADRVHIDPDLGHRHLRAALFLGADAQHDDVRRARARRRHGRRRRDRRARELVPAHGAPREGSEDRAIDGSEEVWSAILSSILTHIAVFVPLLFLTGISSIMFRQLSVVVVFSLADVAVRRGHARARSSVPSCSSCRRQADQRRGSAASCTPSASARSKRWTTGYRRLIHLALAHRPTVVGLSIASVVAAVLIMRTIPT